MRQTACTDVTLAVESAHLHGPRQCWQVNPGGHHSSRDRCCSRRCGSGRCRCSCDSWHGRRRKGGHCRSDSGGRRSCGRGRRPGRSWGEAGKWSLHCNPSWRDDDCCSCMCILLVLPQLPHASSIHLSAHGIICWVRKGLRMVTHLCVHQKDRRLAKPRLLGNREPTWCGYRSGSSWHWRCGGRHGCCRGGGHCTASLLMMTPLRICSKPFCSHAAHQVTGGNGGRVAQTRACMRQYGTDAGAARCMGTPYPGAVQFPVPVESLLAAL